MGIKMSANQEYNIWRNNIQALLRKHILDVWWSF